MADTDPRQFADYVAPEGWVLVAVLPYYPPHKARYAVIKFDDGWHVYDTLPAASC